MRIEINTMIIKKTVNSENLSCVLKLSYEILSHRDKAEIVHQMEGVASREKQHTKRKIDFDWMSEIQ